MLAELLKDIEASGLDAMVTGFEPPELEQLFNKVATKEVQEDRDSGNGSKEKARDHPLYFLMHDEPNPEMTSFVFRETMMTHLSFAKK